MPSRAVTGMSLATDRSSVDSTVRLAGRKDFDTFRVVFDGYDNPQEYEFDTAQ